MGLPIVELPFMCNLAVDVHTAVKMLLGMGEFQYLADRFSGRRNLAATRLHYALSSKEDAILNTLETQLAKITGV